VEPATLENPFSKRSFPILRVPPASVQDAAAFPRLRRSSGISHFAVAAAMDAATNAGLDAEKLARTALVFAASDGGVVYTRRFYADVVERGGGAGSPLLFPETVYNAPASHIAARLGLAGEVLTLVGDAAAGLMALRTGCELLAAGEADYCLVASAQELDWITCEAYERWGLIGTGDPQGAIFSEGAAAIVLARSGGCEVRIPHAGFSFSSNEDASVKMDSLINDLMTAHSPQVVISSGSGAGLDAIEERILSHRLPAAQKVTPKFTLGESLSCSAIQQVITGVIALQKLEKPGDVLVPTLGFNGQMAALVLTEGDCRA